MDLITFGHYFVMPVQLDIYEVNCWIRSQLGSAIKTLKGVDLRCVAGNVIGKTEEGARRVRLAYLGVES